MPQKLSENRWTKIIGNNHIGKMLYDENNKDR